VQDAVVRIAAKVMGERLFLITDAVTESLHGDYVHVFRGDRYTLPDGTLSGSCLTMLKAVQRCVEVIGLPLSTSLRMASFIPAHLAGAVMGKIEKGYQANLCFFDEDFHFKGIIVDGQIL
jgi:N-acetylglucosamine-6-phosphate deacetylase